MNAVAEVPRGALRLDEVTKTYDRRAAERWWRHALPLALPDPLAPVVAVDRMSLDITPGERVGLIGPNGAGKSTILKLIAGVTQPTAGRIVSGGHLGAMIELGLGFHPDLTGWENVRVSAAVMGLDRADADELLPAIVEFAGIGDAMDEQLKHYSTGMRARLGFALATQVPADLLLVDEVLAVGDPQFQERCVARIDEMCAAGTTLLLVTHEMWVVDSTCDRALLLEGGALVDDGPAPEVIDRYLSPVPRTRTPARSTPLRFRSFTIDDTDLGAGDPVHFTAHLDVGGPVDIADIEISFAWASIAPDLPIALATHRLPIAALSEEATFVGTSSPIPTDTGHVGVRARLINPREGTTLDEAAAEFWIGRGAVGRRPQLAVDVDWTIEPDSVPVRPGVDGRSVVGPDAIAHLDGVTKRFHTGEGPRFDRRLLPGAWGDDTGGDLLAVDDVTLTLTRGSATGVIGPNGAGKTTLLRLLAGTMAPTRGRVSRHGRVVSMLELGLGFHPDLSGRDNIDLAGRLLGLGPRQLRDRVDAIIAFSGIGDAVEAPVKQYSSGMRARLGLAVAVHAEPELLLIDEALAVGDEAFRERAIRTVDRLGAEGVAIVFVSHDLRLVEEVCDRVVRLERGRVAADGPTEEIIGAESGADWDGGVTRQTTAVALGPLRISRRRIVTGGRLEFAGEVELTAPTPWLRLELSYRANLGLVDETPDDVAANTIFTRVLESAGERLRGPGHHRFHTVVDGNAIAGDVLVVVSAIDEREEEIVAESWQAVTFGNPRPGGLTSVSCPVEVIWTPASGATA